jgi:hypothetical protein
MAYTQNQTILFTESTSPHVTHYEVDVMVDAYRIGETQSFSSSLAVNGEVSFQLSKLTAIPVDAQGFYTIYVYSVDSLGRSELPLNIWHVELDFTLEGTRFNPIHQNKTSVLLKNATQPFFSTYHPAGDRT